MYFISEYHCNAEWSSDPSIVAVSLGDDWELKIKQCVLALGITGGDFITFWWGAGYEFYDEKGKVFEPDYSVDGCTIKVYKDGHVQAAFPFKHSSEEGWTDDFKWEDGVKKVTKKDLVKKFKEAAGNNQF